MRFRSVARAGLSADRHFRSARSAWRRSIRRRLLLAVSSLALVGGFALFLPRYGEFYAGLVFGGCAALVIAIWDQHPHYIENWRMGRDGERWTEEELRPLERQGWVVRHDLQSRYGNIDHVVVGPAGVFLLNSKNLWGSFAIEEGTLTCHHLDAPLSDYALPKLDRQMAGAAFGLRGHLKERLGWIVEVQPTVVLWAKFEAAEGSVGRTTIVRGDRLADWLAKQPHRLSESDRVAVGEVVASLPSAT